MSKLEDIINDGKELAYSLYEARNEVIAQGTSSAEELLAGELLVTHDEVVRRFTTLENFVYDSGEVAFVDESEGLDLGTKLTMFMASHGWNSTILAEKAGVSRTTIENILKGESTPRRATLAKLEKALGMEEGALDE